MRINLLRVLSIFLILGFSNAALAEVIGFRFSGYVAMISDGHVTGIIPGTADDQKSTFDGYLLYDSDTDGYQMQQPLIDYPGLFLRVEIHEAAPNNFTWKVKTFEPSVSIGSQKADHQSAVLGPHELF